MYIVSIQGLIKLKFNTFVMLLTLLSQACTRHQGKIQNKCWAASIYESIYLSMSFYLWTVHLIGQTELKNLLYPTLCVLLFQSFLNIAGFEFLQHNNINQKIKINNYWAYITWDSVVLLWSQLLIWNPSLFLTINSDHTLEFFVAVYLNHCFRRYSSPIFYF